VITKQKSLAQEPNHEQWQQDTEQSAWHYEDFKHLARVDLFVFCRATVVIVMGLVVVGMKPSQIIQ
jgi:hypothetical protein